MGEEALSATLRPTPTPSASASGRTPLLSLGRYQGEASEAPSAQNVGRRSLSGEGPDSAATSGLCDLDLSSVPAFGAKPVLIFWTQVVSPTPLASLPVPYYPAPEYQSHPHLRPLAWLPVSAPPLYQGTLQLLPNSALPPSPPLPRLGP